jgi:ornithine carbamoyltransferase
MTIEAPARPRHVLQISDLDTDELVALLNLAETMKHHPAGWKQTHHADTLVTLFEKPSTRTRVSFAAAAHRLGMLPLVLRDDELQLGRGETIADTARVLSGYAAAIAVRTFAQERLEELAEAASVPVINALSDQHHPCQALADLLTLREHFHTLRGLKLAYVGDGNNVAHSLLQAGALVGMHISVASPFDHRPDPDIVDEAALAAEAHGGSVTITADPGAAVHDAHAVYTDVWVSMGDEATAQQRRAELAAYAVTEQLMAKASTRAVFLHCLPAHRGEEVEAAVIDGPQSLVFVQAANRMPTEQALIHWTIQGGHI